ncbi:MAG: hypothetical protein J6V15_07035 [Clostridia bacterium]|nr:hypothetical protein [Clostridia bacterium]
MNKRKLIFAVSPGGAKHEILAKLLVRDGYETRICEEEDALGADYYITPKAKDRAKLISRGITPIEYLGRQDFKECNGILTAEAAIAEAIAHTPFALAGSRVLVTGSGCIAMPLSARLRDMGAAVTLCARSAAARTRARLMGFAAVDICFLGGEYELVFNTVPHRIFDEAALSALWGGAVIIDLASLPGGVDEECAEKLGISVIHALALPGKYMPETSAKIIRACVRSFIKERVL